MIQETGPPTTPLLLQLGCGHSDRPGPGWLNCDLSPGANVDLVFDLMQPWPFADGAVQGLYASHVLEHLPQPLVFFQEAWRVLEDRCQLKIRVPYGGHRSAWCDPTHLRPWFAESFAFLQPGYNAAIHNPQHDAWETPFLVEHASLRLGKAHRWVRWLGPLRRRLLPQVQLIPDAIEELWVTMMALKSPALTAYWRTARHPNAVPMRFIMYAHDWAGRPYQPGDPLDILDISGRPVQPAAL